MKGSMMKKMDTDKSGAISSNEFKTALNKSGSTNSDYSSVFSYLDSNSDSSISQSELETGLNNINSSGKTSTSQNAAASGGTGKTAGASGAGAAGGAGGVSSTSGSSGSSTSISYDVRDTNQDGKVSINEEMAYQLKHITDMLASSESSNANSGQSQLQQQQATSTYQQTGVNNVQNGMQSSFIFGA